MSNVEVIFLIFGYVLAVISIILYMKLYGYLQVSLQDTVHLVSK